MTGAATSSDRASWTSEITSLMSKPLQLDIGTYREGKIVGFQATPHKSAREGAIDLQVSIFARSMPTPSESERQRRRAIAQAGLCDLQDENSYVRAATCEALGQLGDPSIRPALEMATNDPDSYVRAVARQALVVLDVPRIAAEELADLSLTLWQLVAHLQKPLATVRTNRRGQAWFRDVPSDATYRLQARKPRGDGGVVIVPETEERIALAAEPAALYVEATPEQLPVSTILTIGEIQIRCTVFRDDGRVKVEFYTDAIRLDGTWVPFKVKTKAEEVVSRFVQLKRGPQAEGIVSAAALLDEPPPLAKGFEIVFEEPVFEPTAGE